MIYDISYFLANYQLINKTNSANVSVGRFPEEQLTRACCFISTNQFVCTRMNTNNKILSVNTCNAQGFCSRFTTHPPLNIQYHTVVQKQHSLVDCSCSLHVRLSRLGFIFILDNYISVSLVGFEVEHGRYDT